MRLFRITALIIGVLLGASYVMLVPNAEAAVETIGPFTFTSTNSFMGMYGTFSITPDGAQVGDVVAAFVSDVVTGTPTG
jgi:hypothetical protein